MTDEVAKEAVTFAVGTGKVTGTALYRALRAYIRVSRMKKMKGYAGKGEQTVKQLIGQGQGASSMAISGESIRDFKRIANKYGVDFAIVKDKTVNPPRYTCFFKAKDIDAITAVAQEYAAKVVKLQTKPKPSLLKQIRKLKDAISKMPHKERTKSKEKSR